MTTIKESGNNEKDTDEEDLSFTEQVLPVDEHEHEQSHHSSFIPPTKSDDVEDKNRSINVVSQTKQEEQEDPSLQTNKIESGVHMTETTQKVLKELIFSFVFNEFIFRLTIKQQILTMNPYGKTLVCPYFLLLIIVFGLLAHQLMTLIFVLFLQHLPLI